MILNDAASVIFNGREPEVWLGGTPPVKVWPSHNVVDIALGNGFAARDQFRAALTARGMDFATVTELPFDINLTGSGGTTHLFQGCRALTSIPPLNTVNVTNMNGMFQDCNSLATVPPLDTRNVTNAPSVFAYCRSLTSVPTMNAAKMTNVNNMFYDCFALTDGNVLLTNKNPNVTTNNMITGSGLTREPWDTVTPPVARKVTVQSASTESFVRAATGDTDLIGGWPSGGWDSYGVSFTAPVTCNQDVRNINTFAVISSGATISAGAGVLPRYHQGTSYVFTEVL